MINGTAEWHALDTNDDGWVDMYDDPYTPFYPGDQWVDWVGMNMYHMGQVSLLLAEWLGSTCVCACVCRASFAIASTRVSTCDAVEPSSRPPASLLLQIVLDDCSNNHNSPPVQLHANLAFSYSLIPAQLH